jgi:Holliday junction resolvase RusA-like endonuclease
MQLKLKLPFKTPTINHLYYHRGNMKILTREARELREKIKEIIGKQSINIEEDTELQVKVCIYENWYNQDGTIKQKDILNREKFLIDSVFKALEIDDKHIFKSTFLKINSDDNKAIIYIEDELG